MRGLKSARHLRLAMLRTAVLRTPALHPPHRQSMRPQVLRRWYYHQGTHKEPHPRAAFASTSRPIIRACLAGTSVTAPAAPKQWLARTAPSAVSPSQTSSECTNDGLQGCFFLNVLAACDGAPAHCCMFASVFLDLFYVQLHWILHGTRLLAWPLLTPLQSFFYEDSEDVDSRLYEQQFYCQRFLALCSFVLYCGRCNVVCV